MKDDAFVSSRDFQVPSRRPDKTVFRTAEAVREVFTEAVGSKIYWATLIYLVSLAEHAFLDLARKFLLHDPRRFLIDNGSKKIEAKMIVDAGNFETLLEQMADLILHDLSYQKPADQMKYFEKVFGISFRQELAAQWFEIKATRDILVHNGGMANGIYIQKAGSQARVACGEMLPIDRKYFHHVVVTLKSLVGGVCSAVQLKLKADALKNKA